MNYVIYILILICIYVILGQSLNLVVGYTGLLALSHAACYGIGAYVSTLMMMRAGWGFLSALLLGIIGAMVLNLIVGLPSLRLKGDFFILATLAFQMIVFSVIYNWVDVTGGPYGIAGIPKPKFLGLVFRTPVEYLALSFVTATLVLVLCWRLSISPFGKVLEAIREDEVAAIALGKNVFVFKTEAFVLAGGMAATAGVLFAGYVTYIDPSSFTLDESIFILAIIIVGGAGTFRGPLIGATILVLLPEALRFLRVPDTVAPNVREIIYGILLVVMMKLRPQGLAGKYSFD